MKGVWLMTSIVACWLLCTCILMTSAASAQPYHDAKQMKNMVRLFEGLKRAMQKRMTDVRTRVSNMFQLPDQALQSTTQEVNAGDNWQAWETVDSVSAALQQFRVTAALLITADPFPGDGNPHLTNLKLNYGLNILASNSLITVLRSGLYILDLKVQTADYWYTTQSIEWTDSSGALIKNFALFTDFEVAPHHKFLDMHAGDSLRAKPVSTYNGRSPLKTVDIGTQMSLRFVGTKGSNSPSAVAAP
ncbi:hypothetical protein BaRGS_00010272 [Batillaria attramentaria]|uniref:Uncharacterized protein n=1 Tax=Batillaria attramentaria TaxID=370345 RepID=A0ABD0LHV6_9CAEN